MAAIKTTARAIKNYDGQPARYFLVFTLIGPSALFFTTVSFAGSACAIAAAMTF
jgi:hypothetical protein